MTGPGLPQGRRAVSLRALLVGAAAALLVFLVVSVIALVRLVPQARGLGQRGEGLTEVSQAMEVLDSSLSAMEIDLETLTRDAEATGRRLDPERAEALRLRLRLLADSTFNAQGRSMDPIPDSARILLARVTLVENDAVTQLLDAEARLELGDAAGARNHVAQSVAQRRTTHHLLDVLAQVIVQDLAEREFRYARASDRAIRFATWWAIVGFLLVAVVTVLAYERLYRPLGVLERGLRALAAGDYPQRLRVRWDDELGRLQSHLNHLADMVRERATVEAQHAHTLTERLGRVLDEGSNEIYIFDATTWRLVVTNRAARRNLGYTEAQLATMTPLDLLPDFTRERFAAVLETVRSGVQPRAFLAATLRRADRSLYRVEMSLQYSETERPPVFHAVVQDVSERLRIEAERDLVFQQSADLMAIANLETGRVVRANPALAATLGVREHVLAGRGLVEYMHPEDQALVRRQLEQLGQNVPMRGTAVRMHAASGEYRWISWNIDPPRDGMIYAIGRDITDRRRAETRQAELQAAVARSAREWRMTFDALDDPVVIVSHAGQIVRLNEAARRLAGQPHTDILGRSLDALEPLGLWQRAGEMVAEMCRSGTPASAQLRCDRDVRTWDLQVHPVPGAAAGQMAAIVVAHDVTPVVQLQDTVRRSEAMAAMGVLVAGVAHEVRNPLFSMTATLDAFEARFRGESSGQRHIQVLRTQLDRLQQLMRELLEYGKPPHLAISSVGFDAVIRQATEETALVARERGIALEVDVPPGLPHIRADRARLAQVYVNLLTNAMHHSPDGGRVTIRARGVRLNGASWLETVVEDSGQGFRPEDLPRIFEPFFTRRPGGTGLGLALVQRIVEQHGGSVTAGNRPDGGAAVAVRLPLTAE